MKPKTKKIILNIAFYLALVSIYSVTIFSLINRFNNETIYLGNTRVDIVLTDSMSERNEKHADFLEGTTQIQPFDMVVSKKINEDTELNVKDCVLFKNPKLNNRLVVHRIINITHEGIPFEITKCEKTTFDDIEVTKLIDDGMIKMSSYNITDVKIEAYSPKEYSQYFVFYLGKNSYPTQVETTKINEGVYKHIITFSRESSVPFSTTIAPGTDEPLYVSNITYTSKTKGDIEYKTQDLVVSEEGSYNTLFADYYMYETRGDKGTTADGSFERSELIAKVNHVIPKLGHVVHFLQSLPGMIMLMGLTIIITFASYLMANSGKKERKKVTENGEIIENIEEKKEPETKEDKNKGEPKDKT